MSVAPPLVTIVLEALPRAPSEVTGLPLKLMVPPPVESKLKVVPMYVPLPGPVLNVEPLLILTLVGPMA